MQLGREVKLNEYQYSTLNWALTYPLLKSLPFQAFDYEANPLSLRLLRILPSQDFSSEIQCEVFHATIESRHLSYDALSYAWGDPLATAPIILNGKRQDVTVNLELALHYLRGTEERIIWIDAICINQRDLREKNYQVQRMRSIYLNARAVVIWLGEEGTAMRALRFCERTQMGNVQSESEDRLLSANIMACFDLFVHRPYWNRVWTVQEVCHDREIVVQIGKLNVAITELNAWYDTFRVTVLQGSDYEGQVTYERYFRISSLPPPAICGRHKFSGKQSKGTASDALLEGGDTHRQPLLDMLQSTRSMEASDPRDKLFALHGLVKEHELITVDYNASKRDVYTQTISKLLSKDPSTLEDILLSVESVCTDKDLPSWVPNFAAKQRSIPLVMRYWARCFCAADMMGSLSFHEDGELKLSGCSVGRITSTTNAKVEDSTIQDDELKKFSLIGYAVNQSFPHYSPVPIRKPKRALSDTFVVNTSRGSFSGKKDRPSPSFLSQDKPSISLLGAKREVDPPFLKTSWGPLSAKVGDIICCINGCRVPLVLREVLLTEKEMSDGYSEPRFHNLVGACFLIDSKLEATPNFMNDRGFSKIMRGLWKISYDPKIMKYFRLK